MLRELRPVDRKDARDMVIVLTGLVIWGVILAAFWYWTFHQDYRTQRNVLLAVLFLSRTNYHFRRNDGK